MALTFSVDSKQGWALFRKQSTCCISLITLVQDPGPTENVGMVTCACNPSTGKQKYANPWGFWVITLPTQHALGQGETLSQKHQLESSWRAMSQTYMCSSTYLYILSLYQHTCAPAHTLPLFAHTIPLPEQMSTCTHSTSTCTYVHLLTLSLYLHICAPAHTTLPAAHICTCTHHPSTYTHGHLHTPLLYLHYTIPLPFLQ